MSQVEAIGDQSGGHRYRWPEGTTCAFTISIDVDVDTALLWGTRGKPESRSLGLVEQRFFGPRHGLERLLGVFEEHGVRGSTYVPAHAATRFESIVERALSGGHEVAMHGYHHELASRTETDELERALDAAAEVLTRQAGRAPAGFRAPGFDMTRHLSDLLVARGLYDSSLMGSDVPYLLGDLLEVPTQWHLDDAVLFKFTGPGDARPADPDAVLATWRREIAAAQLYGTHVMITAHDWISGRPMILDMVSELLSEVVANDQIWVATTQEVAEHHQTTPENDWSRYALVEPEEITNP